MRKEQQAVQNLPSVKGELPSLFFPQYHHTTHDFTSDDEEEPHRLVGKFSFVQFCLLDSPVVCLQITNRYGTCIT